MQKKKSTPKSNKENKATMPDYYNSDKFNQFSTLPDKELEASFELPSEALEIYFDLTKTIDQELIYLEAKLTYLSKKFNYITKRILSQIKELITLIEKERKKFLTPNKFAVLSILLTTKGKIHNLRKRLAAKKKI